MRKAAFVYDEVLSRHVLREDHPLRSSRLKCTYELLHSYSAFDQLSSMVVAPRQAEEEELLRFHTKNYLEAVKSLSRGERDFNPAIYNFSEYGDNPPYLGMYEASALVVGASLVAAELVALAEFEVAFSISGGLHHAAPEHASGFCVFNDVVLAIDSLVNKGERIAYIDIDAHHGDGVQDAFYTTDKVLTISLHESGRYLFPGTGEVSESGQGKGKGYAVNIPLAPHTDDEIYLWAFGQIVPPLVQSFKPDIVVSQLGCDTYYLDSLAHLMLTTKGYVQAVTKIGKLAPRWLALGGGGYEIGAVARLWTLAYGVMIDREWPDNIPEDYRQHYGLVKLRDESKLKSEQSLKEQAWRFAQKSVEEIKQQIFPLHKL